MLYDHSLPILGDKIFLLQKEPELTYQLTATKAWLWSYQNITLEEFSADCGSLYIGNTFRLSEDKWEWIKKFALKYGFNIIIFTLAGDTKWSWFTKIISFLQKDDLNIQKTISPRHPKYTKYICTKILPVTNIGYPE